MPGWIEKTRKLGWFTVEAALLVIVLCVLLDIIIGTIGVGFIPLVAANAKAFLQAIPPGTTLGIVILVFLYWFIRTRK
jgi:hypothetical protein